MKLIKQSVEEIAENTYSKQIEKCGRVCYKSEAKIGSGTDLKFVDMLIKKGHTAMLEHGIIYLTIDSSQAEYESIVARYLANKYSRVVFWPSTGYSHNKGITSVKRASITTNYRVLVQNNWLGDLQYKVFRPSFYHARCVTMKFICSRQVSHQFVRHRVFSFAQESTQYCNYSLGRFGSEITFIEPTWYSKSSFVVRFLFRTYLRFSEYLYMTLLKTLKKPHLAAAILPNATKTELCMTGFVDDWRAFIQLREADDNISQTYELIKDMYKQFSYLFV